MWLTYLDSEHRRCVGCCVSFERVWLGFACFQSHREHYCSQLRPSTKCEGYTWLRAALLRHPVPNSSVPLILLIKDHIYVSPQIAIYRYGNKFYLIFSRSIKGQCLGKFLLIILLSAAPLDLIHQNRYNGKGFFIMKYVTDHLFIFTQGVINIFFFKNLTRQKIIAIIYDTGFSAFSQPPSSLTCRIILIPVPVTPLFLFVSQQFPPRIICFQLLIAHSTEL